MAKDTIVTFCARIGLRSACLVTTNCPLDGRGQGHVTSSFLANKCQYLENGARNRYTNNGRL